jgi:hypothetical protein
MEVVDGGGGGREDFDLAFAVDSKAPLTESLAREKVLAWKWLPRS